MDLLTLENTTFQVIKKQILSLILYHYSYIFFSLFTLAAKQKTTVSGKRSDKRNGKIPKSKCDSFSVKAGLSSFSSSAGGNNILGMSFFWQEIISLLTNFIKSFLIFWSGVYGSKHDICDFGKHVDEVSLNELLDGSYKCPDSMKDKEKKTEAVNGRILLSVREACSILQLKKPGQTSQTPNVTPVDGNHNASSSLPNAAISGANMNDDNKGDAGDPSSCKKVSLFFPFSIKKKNRIIFLIMTIVLLLHESPTNYFINCSFKVDVTDLTNILQFPLFPPKDVLDRLSLLPPKDLDLMLLDSMKPTSTSKGKIFIIYIYP